ARLACRGGCRHDPHVCRRQAGGNAASMPDPGGAGGNRVSAHSGDADFHVFFAEVRTTQKVTEGGGLKADGEDIEIVEFDVDDFFKKLTGGEFEDPKLIIAGQWFMAQRGNLRAEF